MMDDVNFTIHNDTHNDPYHNLYYGLYSTLIIMGIVGNLTTIVTIGVVKELHTTTFVFILNLAIMDLLLSAFVDLFSILGVLLGSDFFHQHFLLCQIIAGASFVFGECSLTSILFVAINRYINICKQKYYNRVFTKTKTIFYLIFIWTFAILNVLPHVFGWGGLVYDEQTESCIWNRLSHHSYNLYLGLGLIMTPCVVVLALYLKIFRYVSNSLRNLITHNKQCRLSKRELNKSFVVAKSLFISYIAFVICWLTYALVIIFDYGNALPNWVHLIAALMAHSYSSINPCLYFIFNPSLRAGYKRVVFKLMGRITQVNKTNEKC